MSKLIETKLKHLGIDLPVPTKPVASYVPFKVVGSLVYISGQLPIEEGQIQYTGPIGSVTSVEDGVKAARLCAINIISQLQVACGGNLDHVQEIVKLGGFIASDEAFTDQPEVMNGASDLMVDVFGVAGAHARAAVGVNVLPLGASVEVEAVVRVSAFDN